MPCSVWMKVGLCLALSAAVGLVSGNAEVMKSSSAFSCCGRPTIPYDEDCETTWSIHDMPIACSKGVDTSCIPPCMTIGSGVIELDKCTDVNATVVCSGINVITEKSVYYYGRLCSPNRSNQMAPGDHGAAGLFLLAAIVTGGFVKY